LDLEKQSGKNIPANGEDGKIILLANDGETPIVVEVVLEPVEVEVPLRIVPVEVREIAVAGIMSSEAVMSTANRTAI